MLTSLIRTNIHTRRVVGVQALQTYFLDYVDVGIKRFVKAMTTGFTSAADKGRWHIPVTMADGAGASTITFGQLRGADGNGQQIDVAAADGSITDVPFQNTTSTTYYVGAMACERPAGISQDTLNGACYYDHYIQELGHLAAPSAVSDAGTSLQFTIQNHIPVGDSYTSRTAICYLVNPVSPNAAVAIESATVSGSTVTLTGYLGQAGPSASMVASDYRIIILGPRITRTNITNTTGVAFIGTVLGAATPRTYVTTAQLKTLQAWFTSTSTTLTVTGNLAVSGDAAVTGDLTVDDIVADDLAVDDITCGTITTDAQIQYATAGVVVPVDFGGPAHGGWTLVDGDTTHVDYIPDGSPPHVTFDTNGGWGATFRRNIMDQIQVGDVIDTISQTWKLTTGGGSNGGSVALYSENVDNINSAKTLEHSYTLTDQANFTHTNETVTETIQAGKRYWLELFLTQSGAGDRVYLASIHGSITRHNVK